MVLCGVRTDVFTIVKANIPSKPIYQFSHGNNRDSTPGFKELC